MSNNTTIQDKPVNTGTSAQTWTEAKIRVVEARIARTAANLEKDLVLGIEQKFYKITGDKTAAAWVTRVLPAGFKFTAPVRKAVAPALVADGATIPQAAAATGAGVGTVHRDVQAAGVTPAGGTKSPGGGRKATAPATVPATVTVTAPVTETETETETAPATVPDASPDVYGAVVSVLDRLSRQQLVDLALEIKARLDSK